MDERKIDELLRLERENNQMLRYLVKHISQQTDEKDFTMNVLANILAGRL